MATIDFARPAYFYLLLVLIPIIVWYIYTFRKAQPELKTSSLRAFAGQPVTWKVYLKHFVFGLRLIAIILLIIALARPQSTNNWENTETLGIDIMLSLDISGSMLARDFKPDRIGAAKQLATEFISGRPNDRIGLVVFSGESFTQCPLTSDHTVLINLFNEVQSGIIEDGTAIGVGLANAVKRLKDSEAISKVIILLTDGVNNSGAIDPLTAADLAKTFGIRVYTIGVGTRGEAPYPAVDFWGRQVFRNIPVEIDEEILGRIAELTGGKYFRATDNNKLREIYSQIDELEKSKINVKEYSRKEERYMVFLWMALGLILAEIIVKKTLLRSLT
ncbi:MAG: VWA domain-containing protein [Bacteroidales bacterium]|nr:VWA domain-containing protein [Bacteroidales bacterium]